MESENENIVVRANSTSSVGGDVPNYLDEPETAYT